MAYYNTTTGSVIFGYDSPTASDKPRVQNAALRKLALDNLAKEFDEISARAQRAASTLRQLKPMLPTAERR